MQECPDMARSLCQGFSRQFMEWTRGYPDIIGFLRRKQLITTGFVDSWNLLVWE